MLKRALWLRACRTWNYKAMVYCSQVMNKSSVKEVDFSILPFFFQFPKTSRNVAINLLKLDCNHVFTGFTIMQSCMKIPLVTKLCVLRLLLITLCSANVNNSSKPRDKVSSFDQILQLEGCLMQIVVRWKVVQFNKLAVRKRMEWHGIEWIKQWFINGLVWWLNDC